MCRYGAGHPVIYLTTSSLPGETNAVRAALSKRNFRVIAPYRPGFGGSSAPRRDGSDALIDDWSHHLRAACGTEPPIIVGHREGGILAARLACKFMEDGASFRGLALISTGAPVKDVAQFKQTGASIRRSFLTAQTARLALTLGYRTAARFFRSGRFGEDRLVRFFVQESAVDQRGIEAAEVYAAIRDNLEYCFENPTRSCGTSLHGAVIGAKRWSAWRISTPICSFTARSTAFCRLSSCGR